MHAHFRSRRIRIAVAASIAATAAVTAVAVPASAHMGIDLGGNTPTAGSSSVFWFRPGHGCDGDATNTLTVTVPEGVTGVKAQPKSGWNLTSDGKTIVWSRGSLPDDQFDDFGIRLTWPKLATGVASQKFYFQSVQVCNAELKVARGGKTATITGFLPYYAGRQIALFVDDVPLTIHPINVGADGRFAVSTTSSKVPEGSDVQAQIGDRTVGNSIASSEAWVQIPTPGSTATLDMPAPSVTVVAPPVK